METDPLARDEFVCRYVETITQSYFKQLFHLFLIAAEKQDVRKNESVAGT